MHSIQQMTYLCDIIYACLPQRWELQRAGNARSSWNDIAYGVWTSQTPLSKCHRCVIFFFFLRSSWFSSQWGLVVFSTACQQTIQHQFAFSNPMQLQGFKPPLTEADSNQCRSRESEWSSWRVHLCMPFSCSKCLDHKAYTVWDQVKLALRHSILTIPFVWDHCRCEVKRQGWDKLIC